MYDCISTQPDISIFNVAEDTCIQTHLNDATKAGPEAGGVVGNNVILKTKTKQVITDFIEDCD